MKRERTTVSISDSGRKRRKGDYLEENGISVDGGEIRPATAFDALDVPDGLKTALSEFDEPTPIQACTWPPALDGRDVVGIAETGRFVYSLLFFITRAHRQAVERHWRLGYPPSPVSSRRRKKNQSTCWSSPRRESSPSRRTTRSLRSGHRLASPASPSLAVSRRTAK